MLEIINYNAEARSNEETVNLQILRLNFICSKPKCKIL